MLPSNCLDLCVFDKLVVRLLRLMHRSQKSFLPRFLYDLPVGHDTLLNAPLYQTWSFQDNANDDKFHHPALCALPLISLIQECGEGSALSAEGHVVWLNDAEAAAFIPLFRHILAGSSRVTLIKERNAQCKILLLKSEHNNRVSCIYMSNVHLVHQSDRWTFPAAWGNPLVHSRLPRTHCSQHGDNLPNIMHKSNRRQENRTEHGDETACSSASFQKMAVWQHEREEVSGKLAQRIPDHSNLYKTVFAYIKSLQQELVFIQNKSNLVTGGDDLIAIGFILAVNADFCAAS